MDVDMDASPSYFDPQDSTLRQRYRRYGKRLSPSPHQESYQSKFSNAALFLENIKKEVDPHHSDDGDQSTRSSSKRRSPSTDSRDVPNDSLGLSRTQLKLFKHEEDTADATFSLFASLFDSALQGLMSIPDLILRLEGECRNVSESINNSCSERHRIVEDKLMRQKAKVLLDEAASWSLLWYLYGKGNEEVPEDLVVLPTTSHLEACQFVAEDHTAQLCLRLIQWLEGLASKALDLENKIRGSHVGTHLPTSGVWNHTQRFLKKGSISEKIVQHLDFDAPTREHAQPLLMTKYLFLLPRNFCYLRNEFKIHKICLTSNASVLGVYEWLLHLPTFSFFLKPQLRNARTGNRPARVLCASEMSEPF